MPPADQHERIARAAWERAQSDAFPCPYMGCAGTIHIDWDRECDDMGYPIASWPVFQGECEVTRFTQTDVEYREVDGRMHELWREVLIVDGERIEEERDYGPVNHGERLNWECAERGDYDIPEAARLLGMAAERAALRKALPSLPLEAPR